MRNLQIYRYIAEVAKSGSVRKAAEKLAITPSSLNRRIQSFEYEIGGQIFERNARGLRLNPAGELAVHTFKKHLADVEELKARIEDLKGIRRGRVAIKASQALLPHFLPKQVLTYQRQFPGVDFSISVADLVDAEQALLDYDVDLAILFSALPTESFKTVARVEQSVFAIMAPGHPLADNEKLSLSQCVEYPLALHDSSFSVGQLLEAQAHRSRILAAMLRAGKDDVKKPLDVNKLNKISVQLIQLRGRTLSVAAAKFAEQIGAVFMAMSEEKPEGIY